MIPDSVRYFLPRRYYAAMRFICARVGHDWSPWTYSENPESEIPRHRHHSCYRCGTSSGEAMAEEFPSGVWVERYETEWDTPLGEDGWSRRGHIVGIHRRLVP